MLVRIYYSCIEKLQLPFLGDQMELLDYYTANCLSNVLLYVMYSPDRKSQCIYQLNWRK